MTVVFFTEVVQSIDETITGWWLTYPSEKYEFVNGKDDIPYMKWKIRNIPKQPMINGGSWWFMVVNGG